MPTGRAPDSRAGRAPEVKNRGRAGPASKGQRRRLTRGPGVFVVQGHLDAQRQPRPLALEDSVRPHFCRSWRAASGPAPGVRARRKLEHSWPRPTIFPPAQGRPSPRAPALPPRRPRRQHHPDNHAAVPASCRGRRISDSDVASIRVTSRAHPDHCGAAPRVRPRSPPHRLTSSIRSRSPWSTLGLRPPHRGLPRLRRRF
jgi:hypothetical protein